MAKLGSYYGLCPLIDHRSLLGLSRDEEDGVVIVTLGKNIAIKFKVSDQKQLHSWRTKDKFSSPIIYDKEQAQYVAVFNDSFVRTWSGNEEFLDKLKKLKFNQQIHTIFVCNEKSFIVFKNGAISLLRKCIENRKDLLLEDTVNLETEFISDVLYTSFDDYTYIALVICSNSCSHLGWLRFNELNQQEKFYRIKLHRNNTDLRGYVLHVDRTSVNFLSLWSDGRMYSRDLKEDSSDIGDLFGVMESISCKEYVSVISLDQSYIALYGCNSNEEGALLIIYNVQFKVVQSCQSFKLFTNGAKVWCIDSNLFFPVGQNLAVVPFHLDTEQLAALVGSHKVVENNLDPDISIVHKVQYVTWGKSPFIKDYSVPESLRSKIEEFLTQGLTKNLIFDALLADLTDQKNIDVLEQTIQYFTDVPESGLVKLIKFIVNFEPILFKSCTKNTVESFPQKLQPIERTRLLDMVLTKNFNESLLLPHLRSALTLDEVLCLLQYMNFLLSEDGHTLPSHTVLETEEKLIEWICVLLDSNYQKLLLSKDGNVGEIVLSLKNFVKEELSCSEDLQLVASLMYQEKQRKTVHKAIHMGALDYSIEDFPLY